VSINRLLHQAAAGAGGGPVYVDDVFSCFLHTGGLSNPKVIQSGIDLSGEGGLVWTKCRTSSISNQLTDTVSGYRVESDDSAAGEASQGNVIFNSDGHSYSGYSSFFNGGSEDYVSWTFRKQPGFFDVVTYTGQNGHTQSHNLGSVPGMIIIKDLATNNWKVWHRSASNGVLELNTTAALDTASFSGNVIYNVTSTSFDLADWSPVSNNGRNYVAYVFAHDAQEFGEDSDEAIIKCGSFTGNPSTIDLGFEPQWMIAKKYSSTSPWQMFDTMRGWTADGGTKDLEANTGTSEIDRTSQNYTQLKSTGVTFNSYGGSWIYMAIARPHKPATEFAATDLFHVESAPFTDSIVGNNFPADLAFFHQSSTNNYKRLATRLTQGKVSYLDQTQAEASENYITFDNSEGAEINYSGTVANWHWRVLRRAPGFIDVTTFTGDGLDNKQVNHNLGVVPEMFWVIRRDSTSYKGVYHKDSEDLNYAQTYKKVLFLESNAASTTTTPFRTDLVTASSIAISNQYQQNENQAKYLVCLFASVAGISKVGSYTGTGSNIDVDCGFSSGARFVLVKREDVGPSDWFVWDTARGIVAGNDPYFRINEMSGDITNTDYIDPLSSGFTITSSAPAPLNASGGNYIFYAIA